MVDVGAQYRMSVVQKPVQFRSEGGLRDLREAVKLPISLLISIAKRSQSPLLSPVPATVIDSSSLSPRFST